MLKAYIAVRFMSLWAAMIRLDDEDVPQAINDSGTLGQHLSWNYEHVTKL